MIAITQEWQPDVAGEGSHADHVEHHGQEEEEDVDHQHSRSEKIIF